MTEENILQIGDAVFTLDYLFRVKPDVILVVENDAVHKALMEKATLRFGCVDLGIFFYLIDGKLIQVNGVEKK